MEKSFHEIVNSLGRGNWRDLACQASELLAAKLTTRDEINAAMVDCLDWRDDDEAMYFVWALIYRLKEISK